MDQWHIVGRWQEFRGEGRANLLRLLALVVFYGIELLNFHGLDLGFIQFPKVVDVRFHQVVTALTVSWGAVAALVLVCLRQQKFPGGLKFLAAGSDLFFLTFVLLVADGTSSPLVVAYFLVVALSALRFNVTLVQFSTAGAVIGYLFLMGYGRMKELPRPPHYHSLIFLAALIWTGIIVGQVVRRVRALSEDYAARSFDGKGGAL
jgi:hypothetical protein